MFREIRRKDRLISQEAGIELLKKCEFGVLSVLGDDDYPYGVPVNFAYKDNCIYIHCFLEGHKVDAIKKHPKVCLTAVGNAVVLKDQIATNYTSVIAFGKAEIVAPPEEKIRKIAFDAIIDKFVPNDEEHTSNYVKAQESKTSVIAMTIEHLTCKQRNL